MDGCFLAANLLSNAIPLRGVHSLRIVFPLPTAVRNPIFSINCLAKTFSHFCRSKQQHSVLRLRVVFIQITNICHSPELVSSLLFYLSKLANLFEKQNKKSGKRVTPKRYDKTTGCSVCLHGTPFSINLLPNEKGPTFRKGKKLPRANMMTSSQNRQAFFPLQKARGLF